MIKPGMDALSALEEALQELTDVSAVTVVKYRIPEPLQERSVFTSEEEDIVAKALDVRALHHLPFWDSVMMCALGAHSVPSQLLHHALLHQSSRGTEVEMTRDRVLAGDLRLFVDDLPDRTGLAITSEVRYSDGSVRHLPLLDFHCPPGPQGRALAAAVLQRLVFGEAILLETERSYHGWGLAPLSTNELVDLLARALFFSPIVDRAYIAHQLLERRCALRISHGPLKKRSPTVIQHWPESS